MRKKLLTTRCPVVLTMLQIKAKQLSMKEHSLESTIDGARKTETSVSAPLA